MKITSKGEIMKTLLKYFSVFFTGFMACFSWQMVNDICKAEVVNPQVETNVRSLAEIQEIIGAEPDGIYGPETKAKWDAAINNQYAITSMRRQTSNE